MTVTASSDAVRCERVTVRFTTERGTVTALENIDLAIPRGSFLTLLGPSGCGKSTLLRVMADLIEPTTGKMSVLGDLPAAARATEHCRVFNRSGDDVAADAQDCQVIGLRSAAGKNNLAVGTVQHCRDLATRVVEFCTSGLPVMMDTGGVAENLRHHREHGCQHFRGHRRRRVVIEIISLHGFL